MACCCTPLAGALFRKVDNIDDIVEWAGGNVNAELRFTMMWWSWSDMDFHLKDPRGQIIYYSNKQGILDVDMNIGSRSHDVGSPNHNVPGVENMSYPIYNEAPDGDYTIGFVQYGEYSGRQEGEDVPLFQVVRRYKETPESDTILQDVLRIKGNWQNTPKNTKWTYPVAKFRKQGDEFTLIGIHPEAEITLRSGDKIKVAEELEQLDNTRSGL